ncbi:MAG: PIG-L family deacetylase [Acidobacteriota bacterium]
MRTLILAPHPDDAALCLGGFVERARVRDPALLAGATLVTVFGRTVYAPHAPGASGETGSGAVSALRAREERRFARASGLALELLSLPDSSAIGLSDDDEMVADPATDPRRDDVTAALSGRVAGVDVLLVCAAIGGHVDHRLVRDAALAHTTAPLVLLYEDLPYAAELDGPAVPPPLADPGPAPREHRIDVTGVLDRKRERLRIYRSQLTEDDVDQVLAYAAGFDPPRAVERVWSLDRGPREPGVPRDGRAERLLERLLVPAAPP